jgi:hypothetical protein
MPTIAIPRTIPIISNGRLAMRVTCTALAMPKAAAILRLLRR